MTGGDYPGPGAYTVGSEIAGYRLEEQIGWGGMAYVYRARDVQLGRNVALKLLSPQLGVDESFRQRFIRESRAAAGVDHPNIIPIFAAGQSDDGVLYIAMRYVQGGDVRQLVHREGPLPAERAIGIITQVASALDAAHLNGLVHRDIKPANMLLDSSAGGDEQDHVYLADFGLSKRSLSTTGFSSMVTGLTSTGQFLGTPAYVAPEQVEGQTVDGRADLYALACTAFEMLSGAPPFEREDDLAIMWAQVSAPPPALSEQRPDLPPAVDDVIRRALAKNPADRYPACLAFAAALRAALGLHGQPSARPEPSAGPRTVLSGPPAGSQGQAPRTPTQISRPGAFDAASAANEAAQVPETTEQPGPAGPASARRPKPGATPVSGVGERVYPPTEDWESPGRQQQSPPADGPGKPPPAPADDWPGRAPAQPSGWAAAEASGRGSAAPASPGWAAAEPPAVHRVGQRAGHPAADRARGRADPAGDPAGAGDPGGGGRCGGRAGRSWSGAPWWWDWGSARTPPCTAGTTTGSPPPGRRTTPPARPGPRGRRWPRSRRRPAGRRWPRRQRCRTCGPNR